MDLHLHLSPNSTTPSSSSFPHPRQSSWARSSRYSNSPPSPPLASEPFSLQTRRLQLRNARFRGTNISPRKVSDRASTWGSLSAGSDVSIDKENQPLPSEEATSVDKPTGSVRRRVSILQELHDSSQRGRKPRRPSITQLFGPPLDDDVLSLPQTRAYKPEYSRNSSPASIFQDNDTDAEVAYRDRGSPLSLNASHASRPKNNRERTSSYKANRYIDHLETQLAAMQSRLSPMQASTTQSQVSRLRSLSAEIKVLRQEIAEWEDKFETRVDEEVSIRTEVENKLRTKIIFLESQIEENEYRIKELECERDIQAQKLRNAESLRSTNRSLERRVDVLTELLAQSPIRQEPRTPEFSPIRSPGPRLTRPTSMLPYVPARTDTGCQPLIPPSTREFDPDAEDNQDPADIPDLIPDDSTMASSSVSKSQRSSTLSQISSISSRWSVPLPFSSELQGRTPGRSRNMRRFPSGTCTLKPLILPTTATPNPDCARRQSQLSETQQPFSSPNSDRDSPDDIIKPGTCLAQEETLAALEGRSYYYQTFDEAMLEVDDEVDSLLTRRSDTGTGRLSMASIDTDYRPFAFQSVDDDISSPTQGGRRYSYRGMVRDSIVGSRRLRTHSKRSRDDRTPRGAEKTCLSKVYEETNQNNGLSHIEDSAGVTRRAFQEFITTFSAVAQKTVATVWHQSMTRFGKFSWWIMSILLGSQRRDDWLKNSSLKVKSREWDEYRVGISPSPSCSCGQHLKLAPQQQSLPGNSGSSVSNSVGHSITLWARFSVALVVAVALALRHGPGMLLEDRQQKSTVDASDNQVDDIGAEDTTADINNNITRPVTWTQPLTIEDFLTG
ncbi:hypothetical protein BGW36DRAFT_374057 [Talaromyces proteolyticus]|uniref:Centrosomin N-terminal motif 1 domain-containing protein n=1 Tax=Talaromyces proteolyticus TaxID=1131652 RepID=A0AAD4KT32_9EURO|nr:uncharacterized protein BGW36DRAFT_374057 [Talaromyces proteolyticus]KAH8700393.1 hypothetical protein BGW36DRAFT_374057 [Talaromyces proteolyticus]